MISKDSKFYIKAKQMLDEYVAAGGDVNDLGIGNEIYKYIKAAKVKDKSGKRMTVEAKFEFLEHPRACGRSMDVKQQLIDEATSYRQAGNSFHTVRKKLPFYPKLQSYSKKLRLQGINLSHDQIMKRLGFKEYSDIYYRCMGLFELSKYRDENGFVDGYRKNETLKAYVSAIAEYLNIPYYLVVTLVADENIQKCHIATEYVSQVKSQLQQFYLQHGSLKGLKTKNKKLYYQFDNLMKYYADGDDGLLTKEDWLVAFELGGLDNSFRPSTKADIDIISIMEAIKRKFGERVITANDVRGDYYKVVIKASRLGIPIQELFRNYGINYKGNNVDRLSRMQVTQIPYLIEMRKFRDNLLEANGYTKENGYCEEELFEARVKACKLAYDKYKDKMFNFTIDEVEDLKNKKLDL